MDINVQHYGEELEVLDRRQNTVLVQHPDGEMENLSLMNPYNRLVIDHNLYGLLEGDDVLVIDREDQPKITVTPAGDLWSVEELWSIEIGHRDVNITSQRDLVHALRDTYEEESAGPMIELFDQLLDNEVDVALVEALVEEEPFKTLRERGKLGRTNRGLVVRGTLLLTWQGEFELIGQEQYDRSGDTLGRRREAYDVSFPTDQQGMVIEVDDEELYLSGDEMEFFTKLLWAVEGAGDAV